MKSAIKTKWIKALKSGQYAQAQRKLTDGHGFCCLGVLCNLYALEHGVMWVQGIVGLHLDGTQDVRRDVDSLPSVVQKWAGLPNGNPSFGPEDPVQTPKGAAYSLAECNDRGMTFAEVAHLIRERL